MILRGELPVAATLNQAETPAQLPPDAPGFIGRKAELAQLDALLDKACDQSNAVVIPAVARPPG